MKIWAALRLRLRAVKRWLQRGDTPTDRVRLHLGCGFDYWPGYVNIDSSPTAMCDLRLDFTRIAEHYADATVDEIVLIHSLSYLRLWQARELFLDAYRLLKGGGRLVMELPDLTKCAQYALDNQGNNLPEYLEAVRGLYAFGMDQIEQRELFTPYAFGWASWHLKLELEQAGFRQVIVSEPQTHGGRAWRDTRLEAIK